MKVNILTPESTIVFEKLGHCQPKPQRLFLLGEIPDEQPLVALVGARKATRYGRQVAYTLGQELARCGITVVSGLALGIDTEAHRGALSVGKTVAILPGSVTEVYPATNRGLAQQIVNSGGALLSEHTTGAAIHRHSFIERNRLIAGLADAVVVVEAANKSGSLTTAQLALEQGRPVLAVPGNINSSASQGANRLIATGARPVLGVDDVLEEIGFVRARSAPAPRASNAQEQLVIDALESGLHNIEDLSQNCHIHPSELTSILTKLELKNAVRNLPGVGWTLRAT